jgi:23S rRNA (guanosine2251-2'-O)-methyltransferase
MILYGINAVREAVLASPSKIQRVIFVRGKSSSRVQELIDECRNKRLPIQFEATRTLDRKAAGQRHQGVVAELNAISFSNLDEVLSKEPRLLVLLDGIEDPGNLGAVIRTSEAAGVDSLLLPQRHSCGITPTVIRASAGAALHLRICRIGNVAQTLGLLKKRGFWIIGLDSSGEEEMREIDFSLLLVLVVGSENRGLRRLVSEKVDHLIRIPMHGRVASLNLAAAAAVMLYRIVDQRNRLRSTI